MSSVLGKRKSRTGKAEPEVSADDAQEIFRRHFEAQFKPLDVVPSAKISKRANGVDERTGDEANDEEDEDAWSGISDDENSSQPQVEVVDSTTSISDSTKSSISKREAKAFLSSRVPSAIQDPASISDPKTTKRNASTSTPSEEDSAALLRNDLALQRLLSESHLFSASSITSPSASQEHSGRNRHKANDLRLSALGSRDSIFTQAKMPQHIRKGITAAAGARESKRRKEAKENGIILEKAAGGGASGGASKGTGTRVRKREMAVDAPAVGRLRDGMLRLSKRDVMEIQSSGARDRRGGGGGGKPKKRRR